VSRALSASRWWLGPRGLAAAAQLIRPGTRSKSSSADAIGGLLRYGIPEFKMEKSVLDRRLDAMSDAGIVFHTSTSIGEDGTHFATAGRLRCVVLAIGSTRPRLIAVPGALLTGVYPAMTYLEASNRAVREDRVSTIDAAAST